MHLKKKYRSSRFENFSKIKNNLTITFDLYKFVMLLPVFQLFFSWDRFWYYI